MAQAPVDATLASGPTPARAFVARPLAGSQQLSVQSSWADSFDRPNAPTLGPDWTDQVGSFEVSGNSGRAFGSANQWTLHNTASASNYTTCSAALDFLPAASPQLCYVALRLAVDIASDGGVFLKVQDNNSDGIYDTVGLYQGFNGGGWTGGGGFMALATPTTSGRMSAYFTNAGDTVVFEIDNNFDGIADEQFQGSGLLSAGLTLGTSTGIAAYNQPFFDNWSFSDGSGPSGPVTYCTTSTSTSGCSASISASAQPSASLASPCLVTLTSVDGQRSGIIFYGIDNSGFSPLPWASGSTSFLCVKPPVQRSSPQNSGGTVGQCNGQLSLDWNAFLSAFPGSLGSPFSAGSKVYAQGWYRDPPAPKTTNLSDAVELTCLP